VVLLLLLSELVCGADLAGLASHGLDGQTIGRLASARAGSPVAPLRGTQAHGTVRVTRSALVVNGRPLVQAVGGAALRPG
jgi:hypothetical protein